MVTEVFDNLKALQEILVEKYDLEAKVNEAPKQLSSQDELLARLKKEYIAKNAEYDELKQKVSSLKLELDEAVKSRESGEKGMDAITTHREYEALEKQISEADILPHRVCSVLPEAEHHESKQHQEISAGRLVQCTVHNQRLLSGRSQSRHAGTCSLQITEGSDDHVENDFESVSISCIDPSYTYRVYLFRCSESVRDYLQTDRRHTHSHRNSQRRIWS